MTPRRGAIVIGRPCGNPLQRQNRLRPVHRLNQALLTRQTRWPGGPAHHVRYLVVGDPVGVPSHNSCNHPVQSSALDLCLEDGLSASPSQHYWKDL